MGLFPTDANDGDEVTNANGTTFKYVAADNKWIIINNITISNIAYNEATWNDNGDAASKDALRNKFEAHDALPDVHHAKQHAMDNATYHTRGDNSVLDATTDFHGFLKKLDNISTHFMDGQGNWATPADSIGDTIVWRTPEPDAFDWTEVDLGAGHTINLDLSGIVPVGAKFAIFEVAYKDNSFRNLSFFHPDALAHGLQKFSFQITVANVWYHSTIWAALDSNRITYMTSDMNFNTWTELNLVVIAWVI